MYIDNGLIEMCVCIILIHTYTHTYTHMHMYLHACLYFSYTHTQTHKHTPPSKIAATPKLEISRNIFSKRIHIHTHVFTCACMHACIFLTHTHTSTHLPAKLLPSPNLKSFKSSSVNSNCCFFARSAPFTPNLRPFSFPNAKIGVLPSLTLCDIASPYVLMSSPS